MFRRRFHRLTTALIVVVSQLFAQLAMANYVCPGLTDGAAMAEMMASGQPCEGMDKAQPALCHHHWASAAQSFELGKLPTPTLPMIIQVLELPLVPDAAEALARVMTTNADGRPPPVPLFLSTLRLRV